jgi:cysteine synthase A
VKLAQLLGPGHTILTFACDSGSRYLSSFYSPERLEQLGLDAELPHDLSFVK